MTQHKRKSRPGKGGDLKINRQDNRQIDNSRARQRARLLSHLKHHRSITTIEARRDLDIMHPAGRIRELRLRGYGITLTWCWQAGHKIGRYNLGGVE